MKTCSCGHQLTGSPRARKEHMESAEHRNKLMSGGGLFDWSFDFLAPRNGYNNVSTETLRLYGDHSIKNVTVYRKPINETIDKVLNLISAGKYEEAKKDSNYDKLFHLGLFLVVQREGAPVNIVCEKNAVINIAVVRNGGAGQFGDTIEAGAPRQSISLKHILDRAQQLLGPKYFLYDGFNGNNCQVFARAVLQSMRLYTPQIESFVFQPLDHFVSKMPDLSMKIAKIFTDMRGIWDRISGGSNGAIDEELKQRFFKLAQAAGYPIDEPIVGGGSDKYGVDKVGIVGFIVKKIIDWLAGDFYDKKPESIYADGGSRQKHARKLAKKLCYGGSTTGPEWERLLYKWLKDNEEQIVKGGGVAPSSEEHPPGWPFAKGYKPIKVVKFDPSLPIEGGAKGEDPFKIMSAALKGAGKTTGGSMTGGATMEVKSDFGDRDGSYSFERQEITDDEKFTDPHYYRLKYDFKKWGAMMTEHPELEFTGVWDSMQAWGDTTLIDRLLKQKAAEDPKFNELYRKRLSKEYGNRESLTDAKTKYENKIVKEDEDSNDPTSAYFWGKFADGFKKGFNISSQVGSAIANATGNKEIAGVIDKANDGVDKGVDIFKGVIGAGKNGDLPPTIYKVVIRHMSGAKAKQYVKRLLKTKSDLKYKNDVVGDRHLFELEDKSKFTFRMPVRLNNDVELYVGYSDTWE